MHLSLSRKTSRLPKRFPVGTTYVVEGCSGEDGNLRVFSRYVVLPNGQRINLGADPADVPEKQALGLDPRVVPVLRQGRGQNQKPARAAASRARRARSRSESATQNTGKGRAARPKKISANGGTSRRHGR
jgi:hypothetical protein